MESNKIWKLTLVDPEDGSGDALVELPDELLAQVGWVEGEQLEIEQVENYILIKKPDSDSSRLILTKTSH